MSGTSYGTAPVALPPLLRLSGITKSYGGVRALVGADLTIATAGEVHTLIGENGSGKSSLLGALSGQLRPDSGTIEIDGRPVAFRDPLDAQRQGIAMVSQEIAIAPHLSITENVLLGRLPGGRGRVNWAAAHRRAADVIADVGLDLRDTTRLVGELRPDQPQMIEIARAISMDARVIVLDEPTSSLTDDEVEHLFAAVHRLAGRGVAVLFVSHRLDEVFRISDAITVLRNGATVAAARAADFTLDSLVSAMVGTQYAHRERTPPTDLADAPVAVSLRGVSSAGAFDRVDLDLREGEIVGVAGLLGSGRSELLETIFGARPLTTGTIELRSKPYHPRHERAAIAHGVAYLPPDRKTAGLMLAMSVLDNLAMVADSAKMRLGAPRRADRMKAFVKASASVRLRAAAPRSAVGTLSGGNQQKVAIAKWFGGTPQLLLLDEPTRGVDIAAKAEIHERLREAAAAGLPMLISSSENPELLDLCHRIVVMSRGRVVGSLDARGATEAAVAALAGGQA